MGPFLSQSTVEIITIPCYMNITLVCYFTVSFSASSVLGTKMIVLLKFSCILLHLGLMCMFFALFCFSLRGPRQQQKMIQQATADISRIVVQKCKAGQQNYSYSCIPESKLIFLFSSVYNLTAMSRINILNSQTEMDDTETFWPFSPCRATAALNFGWGSGRVRSVHSLHIYFPCCLNFWIQNIIISSKTHIFSPIFWFYKMGMEAGKIKTLQPCKKCLRRCQISSVSNDALRRRKFSSLEFTQELILYC